jgi:hypothetical protein
VPRITRHPRLAAEAALPNVPLALDACRPAGAGRYDVAFSANTLHIMGWPRSNASPASARC